MVIFKITLAEMILECLCPMLSKGIADADGDFATGDQILMVNGEGVRHASAGSGCGSAEGRNPIHAMVMCNT